VNVSLKIEAEAAPRSVSWNGAELLSHAATRSGRRRLLVVAADGVALTLALAAALVLFARPTAGLPALSQATVVQALIFVPVRLLCFAHLGLYQSRRVATHRAEMTKVVNGLLWGFLLEAGFGFMVKQPPPRSWSVIVVGLSLVLVSIEREMVRSHFVRLRRSGRMSRAVLVVGSGQAARDAALMAQSDRDRALEIVGYADDLRPVGDYVDEDRIVVTNLDGLVSYARTAGISGVVVPSNEVSRPKMAAILRELAWEGVFVDLTFGVDGIDPERTFARSIGQTLSVVIEPITNSGWRPVAKRLTDIIVATALLIITSPLLLLTALCIRLESAGPILFRQARAGWNNEVFSCLKFRSMVNKAAEHEFAEWQIETYGGLAIKTKADPRITAVGRFIRRWSIDELPQLLNILKGDMSLVGPRPLPLDDVLLTEWHPILDHRHRVRPGLTCTWQVSGRSNTSTDERKRLDVFYVDNWTFWGDMMILGKTVGAVVRGEGAC
jgi:exopolysaccharide biosynthesis polyprenyl glycosylphosphotransferase